MKLIIATLILLGATAFGQAPGSTEIIGVIPNQSSTYTKPHEPTLEELEAKLKAAVHPAPGVGMDGYEPAATINKTASYDKFRDVADVSTEYPVNLEIAMGDLAALTMRPTIYCHDTQKCVPTADSVVTLLFKARSSGLWKFAKDDRELIFITDNTRTRLGPADWDGNPSNDNLFEYMIVTMPLWKFRGIMAGGHVEGKIDHREFTVPTGLAHQLMTLFDHDTK
jgi:hypothetical protein